MRRPIQSLICLGVTWALALSVNAADQVKWQTDLETAFQVAREQNRPLLLHFWSPDCSHCMQVEETVFSRASVAETLGDFFVPVKINTQEHPELAARYRVPSIPKDVILTPTGKEMHRLLTPPSPQQYIAQLSAVAFRSGMSPTRAEQSLADRTASSVPNSDYPDGRGPIANPSTSAIAVQRPESVAYEVDNARAAAAPPAGAMHAMQDQPQEVINRYARQGAGPEARPTEVQAAPAEPAPRDVAQAPARQEPQRTWGPWPDREPAEPPAQSAPPTAPTDPIAAAERPVPPAAAADVQPAPRATAPAGQPPLGMDGYCPVTLLKKDVWKQGDPRYGVVHRGRLYLFAGPDEKEQFFGNPDDYSPVLAGVDAVYLADSGEATEGQRTHGVVYRKRVYLFSSEENLQRFWQSPERYAAPIRQAMETGTVDRLFR